MRDRDSDIGDAWASSTFRMAWQAYEEPDRIWHVLNGDDFHNTDVHTVGY
jgi:hypothetical protein